MRKGLLAALILVAVFALGQKTLVEGQLQGVQRVIGSTIAVELRGCWAHEGAVRCAFSFSGTQLNSTVSLTLRAADFSATYAPTSAGSTTQAEPQTVRARLITEQETADKGPKLDLSLENGIPTIILADFPIAPSVKTLTALKVGSFTFDGAAVAEKIPSETLLEARYIDPEALSFQVGQFRWDFVRIDRHSEGCCDDRRVSNAALIYRLTNTGPEAVFNAQWWGRYFINSAEHTQEIWWSCEAGTPPKLLKDASTTCVVRFVRNSSYDHFKNNLIQLLELRLNDQTKVLRNVYLSKWVR
ncbi:hypothetical protein [Thermus caliditerrae]|uniref:hypothetical protein n=1 Tax=Thermus caliditerrae TaxID=1330700 RepID=UPI001F3E9415|nr:hypothetical protein [Thermus caliditerrae]